MHATLARTNGKRTTRPALSDVVVFRVEDVRCGLDILDIQEIKKIHAHTPVHRAPSWVRGLVNMRGQIITLVDVRERLGLEPRPVALEAPAIIVPCGDELVGLLVDVVEDVMPADPRHVQPPPSNLHGVEGRFFTAVLPTGDGLIALVDKDRLAGLDEPPGGNGP